MSTQDLNYLCLGCMNMLPHPQAVCPECNWQRATSQNTASQLMQGTTIENPMTKNQYLIGKAVGQGGFGIVYVAWDIRRNRKVAIKEYFPVQFVSRDRSNTVILQADTQSNLDFFNKQKKRFRQEAEKMQLFNDSPSVVSVLDFFEDLKTKTAYIVMEFIHGQTFMQILNRQPDKRLPLQTVLANFGSLVDILERMHHTPCSDDFGNHSGIIHRDISPENIMYSDDGTVKLLDFGAARVSDAGYPPTGIIKPGYTPYEQQLSVGVAAAQGAWTDVYAFAATIYRAITGEIPPNSFDRYNSDIIKLPSTFGIEITPNQEQVLLKGLAVEYKNRYQSIRQFYDDLNRKFVATAIPTNNSNFGIYPNPTNNQYSPAIPANNSNFGIYPNPTNNQDETSDSKTNNNKIAWLVAAVGIIASIILQDKASTNETELLNIQKDLKVTEAKLEKYRDFLTDYGYASESYYAEKAAVFIDKNSEVKLPIYCSLLQKTDDGAFVEDPDNKGLFTMSWENKFDINRKANLIIKSGDSSGCATLKFTNTVNSDSFEVLVVVK